MTLNEHRILHARIRLAYLAHAFRRCQLSFSDRKWFIEVGSDQVQEHHGVACITNRAVSTKHVD